jgi:hypothetical protein
MPALATLAPRSSPAGQNSLSNPTAIAGICVAGAIALGLVLWLGVRAVRQA